MKTPDKVEHSQKTALEAVGKFFADDTNLERLIEAFGDHHIKQIFETVKNLSAELRLPALVGLIVSHWAAEDRPGTPLSRAIQEQTTIAPEYQQVNNDVETGKKYSWLVLHKVNEHGVILIYNISGISVKKEDIGVTLGASPTSQDSLNTYLDNQELSVLIPWEKVDLSNSLIKLTFSDAVTPEVGTVTDTYQLRSLLLHDVRVMRRLKPSSRAIGEILRSPEFKPTQYIIRELTLNGEEIKVVLPKQISTWDELLMGIKASKPNQRYRFSVSSQTKNNDEVQEKIVSVPDEKEWHEIDDGGITQLKPITDQREKMGDRVVVTVSFDTDDGEVSLKIPVAVNK
jgi:hypothetical protein